MQTPVIHGRFPGLEMMSACRGVLFDHIKRVQRRRGVASASLETGEITKLSRNLKVFFLKLNINQAHLFL